uniref:Choline transporter-like protein n=1 Tax=Trichogramma kaykai TaxID=54128 RepID=A0ABD2VW85_9HYME
MDHSDRIPAGHLHVDIVPVPVENRRQALGLRYHRLDFRRSLWSSARHGYHAVQPTHGGSPRLVHRGGRAANRLPRAALRQAQIHPGDLRARSRGGQASVVPRPSSGSIEKCSIFLSSFFQSRFGLSVDVPVLAVPNRPRVELLDLQHLPVLLDSIDSIGSEDDYPSHLTFCHFVNGLALVWINCHLFAFFKVSASGAYGTWYWTTNKKDVPKFTALRFIYITLRYHIGPTAFGSLVILICYALQLLIYVFSSSSNDETPGMYECCMTCCRTALYCVKVIVEAVTGMAYIRIGHHGSGFVDAARASFGVFKRNYAKIIILSRITTALCIFIKLMIVILSLLLFWGLLSSQSVELEERLGTLFLLGLCIYIVVNAELRLLQIAIEKMFLCVLEDYEMNSGSQRSYHMSKKLKELVLENRLK